jgi:hypothetical protein
MYIENLNNLEIKDGTVSRIDIIAKDDLLETQKYLQSQIEAMALRIIEVTSIMNDEIKQYQSKLDVINNILKEAK